MRIINLEISNFRGIETANILFPDDSRILCLIGSGDSTKTTILKSIEWILWPSWNLTACDNDFHNSNTDTPIILRGTFSEIPDKLQAEDKFGLSLRRPAVSLDYATDDEPLDNLPLCLTIQLTIDKSLEPKWEVVCNRRDPKPISLNDRKLLINGEIGQNCAKDMVWGRFSVLQKFEDAKGVLHDAHTDAMRKIAENADFHELDGIAETITEIGRQYGVNFNSDIKTRMIIQNSSFSSSVGLFDGHTPLTQRGTGSQRLLSMGLNIQVSQGNALLLIDELENGLEPYRLRSLINELRSTHKGNGQVIMTTHSPIAVAECTIGEILIINSKDGITNAFQLKVEDPKVNATIQGQIRLNSEAFLSKRLIVCEGKTEIGFIRALDTYLASSTKSRMAYNGVSTALGSGNSIFDVAKTLHSVGYDICLFMDSDLPNQGNAKRRFRESGIKVFDWNEGNSIEEQIFEDIPLQVATEIVNIAVKGKGLESIKSQLPAEIPYELSNDRIELKEITRKQQKELGLIAKTKDKEWFKRIDQGELIGNVIFNHLDLIANESKLKSVIMGLSKWINEND